MLHDEGTRSAYPNDGTFHDERVVLSLSPLASQASQHERRKSSLAGLLNILGMSWANVSPTLNLCQRVPANNSPNDFNIRFRRNIFMDAINPVSSRNGETKCTSSSLDVRFVTSKYKYKRYNLF